MDENPVVDLMCKWLTSTAMRLEVAHTIRRRIDDILPMSGNGTPVFISNAAGRNPMKGGKISAYTKNLIVRPLLFSIT